MSSDWTREPFSLPFDPGPWRRMPGEIAGWRPEYHMQAWERPLAGWRVVLSQSRHRDGRRWAHLSMSLRHRMPTWPELVEAKERFLGREIRAIQIAPPRSEYYNFTPDSKVLHLYACLDDDGLPPDFREVDEHGEAGL